MAARKKIERVVRFKAWATRCADGRLLRNTLTKCHEPFMVDSEFNESGCDVPVEVTVRVIKRKAKR